MQTPGDSCTPLLATIQGIRESRRGTPITCLNARCNGEDTSIYSAVLNKNRSIHMLSPSSPCNGHSCVDYFSCEGYAGTSSIDSGYKSSCPTPDLPDAMYPECVGTRVSSGCLYVPKPRISMGTKIMSRNNRLGSDTTDLREGENDQMGKLPNRRTSMSPVSNRCGAFRPRSASTGSRSSALNLYSCRKSHASSGGSFTTSHSNYSRHSSPGRTHSSLESTKSYPIHRTGMPHFCKSESDKSSKESFGSRMTLSEKEIDSFFMSSRNGTYENISKYNNTRLPYLQHCEQHDWTQIKEEDSCLHPRTIFTDTQGKIHNIFLKDMLIFMLLTS